MAPVFGPQYILRYFRKCDMELVEWEKEPINEIHLSIKAWLTYASLSTDIIINSVILIIINTY